MCDVGQLGVEHAGKGKQVVVLVLQGDPHRADAPRVLVLAGGELGDDEVEHFAPGRQVWASQGQNVLAQPVHEGSDITTEPMRLDFGLHTRCSWATNSWSGSRWPARPILARSALRHDVAPLARRASVVARPSHWRWMWNTSPWHGVSPQAALCPARRPCAASAMVS